MSGEGKTGRKAYRLPPCPAYDVEGMESWLADMAQEGLLLAKDGIFAGIAAFERDMPRRVKYRLEASGKGTSMWAENFGDPDPEAVALSGRYGWEYMAKRGDFYIYRFTGVRAERDTEGNLCRELLEAGAERELNTDPKVWALTISAVKKRQEAALFRMFFWLLLYPLLQQLRGGLLLSAIQSGTWFVLLGMAVLFWILADALAEAVSLGKLQKRLLAEGRLNHAKDWRRNRILYYGKNFGQFALACVWLCIFLARWSASVMDEDKTPLSGYAGEPPFATMEDIAGEGARSYGTWMDGIRYNHFREWQDWLAPTNIRWAEHAEVTRADGSVLSGGLYVDYHEMADSRLAGRLAAEYYRKDMRGKHAGKLDVPMPALDYAAIYTNGTGFPTVLLQDGRFLIHATFFQTPQEVPLEEWARIMADSLGAGDAAAQAGRDVP